MTFLVRRPKASTFPHDKYDSQTSQSQEPQSIKAQVYELLTENPLLSPLRLSQILGLDYRRYRDYVTHIRSRWKYDSKNERGSKCSSHAWRGWCFVPNGAVVGIRTRAVDVGWLASRARNRWLLWKDRLGRLQWFETGRINLYVRKPANLGKTYQLICNAFSFTGLVTDIKVLEQVLASIRFKGAHYVFPVGQRLPRLTIDLFKKSNGIIIKVGDVSHPESIEVLACYPDWAERNERVLEQFTETLKHFVMPAAAKRLEKDVGYRV